MSAISAAQYNNFMISAEQIDSLYSAIPTSQAQYDSLSNSALSRGIDRYTSANYDDAVTEFRRAIGLSSFSDNAAKAYDYMAQAYLQEGNTDAAIKTYQEAIKSYPTRDAFHTSLGDIYYKQGQLSEAEAEYKAAINFNSESTDSRYGLGQVYLNSERYSEAEVQFKKVVSLSPQSSIGYYGLGQTYRKMGNYTDALTQLDKAVSLDRNFNDGFLEQGYTYADMGDMDNANSLVNTLSDNGSSLANTLTEYIYNNAAPKISMVYSTNGFDASLGPGTPVADLDSSLSTIQAAKAFTMRFAFTKEMDLVSIQNPSNWGISKATETNAGGAYNWGMPASATDVAVPALPTSVAYNPETFSADVTFTITQNTEGNGTIDPSHIMFRFYGLDAYGKAMDLTADEYSGISQIV
ncbi:MAG TPA: tetratricopeptide repeat protein [Desulfomonilaceae bacterium]|nr:tetratricopeptide repeat protein [Desulfomonilaceae bacterium]